MKKVLIINPPRYFGKNVRRDERSADILENEVSPFYQGAVLAQFLRINNQSLVKVIDANGLDLDYEKLEAALEKYRGFDCAVIKAADDTLLYDVKAAALCKKLNIVTLLWEPILSPAEPEKILRLINNEEERVDFLVLGEAELTISDFLKEGDKAKGLAFIKNGRFNINLRSDNDRLKDLNLLPIPDFNDLPVANYLAWFGEKPWMTLFTSRGCPGSCGYCLIGGSKVFRGYGGKIRTMSAERIFEETEILIKKFGIKHITFWDDCFTLDRGRVERLCFLILEKGLKFSWSCMARVDTVDDKLLSFMKRAGLKRIGFGIESGSQKILDSIPKKVSVNQNYQAIQLAKKHKLWVWIYLLVGLPEEDWDSVNETIKFIKKSRPDYLFLGSVMPFPGTIYYKSCRDLGLVDEFIINKILDGRITTGARSVARSKKLSIEEIEDAKRLIHRAFVFSSLKSLWSKVLLNRRNLNPRYIYGKIKYFFIK